MHIERVGTVIVIVYEEAIVAEVRHHGTMQTNRQCALLDRQRIIQYIQRTEIDIGLIDVECIAIVGI